MRHKLSRNRLNRFTSWRNATVNSLVRALIIRERITTTKAKAKAAQRLAEKLVTMAKKDELSAKRRAYKILCDHRLVQRLFKEIAPRFKSVNGGYTRIIQMGSRRGDCAKTVIFELTKRTEKVIKAKKEKPAKKEEPVKEVKKPQEDKKIEEKKPVKETKKKQETKKPEKETKDKKFLGGIKKLFNKKKHNTQ